MSPEDFSFIAKLLKERSGLAITEDKLYLLESRLMPVVRKNGFNNIEELITSIKGKNIALAEEVTEAMTTNESFFFRDSKPFEQFKQIVLPAMLKERATKKTLRIWCAAASSGQEPYSIAMILNEEKEKLQGWKIEIVGTDISKDILKKARDGKYTQFEVQRGLAVNLLVKYFEKQDDSWVIAPEIRAMVNYKYWNLLDDIKALGVFDVIFCRNVLIYFDHPTKSKVLSKIASQMTLDGFLYLGGAETVLGVSSRFKPVPGQRGVYIINAEGNDLTPSGFMPNATQMAQDINKNPAPTAGANISKAPPPRPMPFVGSTPNPMASKMPLIKQPMAQPMTNKAPATTPPNQPVRAPLPQPTPRPAINSSGQPAPTTSGQGGTVIRKVIVKKVIVPSTNKPEEKK